jgi:polyketide biosynthesis enoyl-CoA hydratase PksH
VELTEWAGRHGTVRLAAGPGLLTVTLDRPDRHNAIDPAVIADLDEALDEAQRRPDCRIVALRATGRSFCAGMDLPGVAALGERAGADDRFLRLLRRFGTIDRIVVAVVAGRAHGGGVGLAAASDLVLATGDAEFALPEALWGLVPCNVLPFLVRRTGFQPAYALTLSTRPIGAAEAQRCRLVDRITDDPAAELRGLLTRAGKIDPVTIGDVKRYFGVLAPLTEEVAATAVAEFARLLSSDVARDRIAAFTGRQRLPWQR